MTIIVECTESNGDWTVGHHYEGELITGGFLALKDDDAGDDFEWSADSRQEYDREKDEYETVWFLPGIEGVSFREIG